MRYKGNINLDGVTSLKDDFQDITILKVSDVKGGKVRTEVFLSSQICRKYCDTYHIYMRVCVMIIDKINKSLGNIGTKGKKTRRQKLIVETGQDFIENVTNCGASRGEK